MSKATEAVEAAHLHKNVTEYGTELVNQAGECVKLLRRCPHCGMIDYRFSSQSATQALFKSWEVGGISKYVCGKCKKASYTLSLQVPQGMEPMEFYKKVKRALSGQIEGQKRHGVNIKEFL